MTVASTSAAERLLQLLPQIFRIRDREEAVRIASLQGFAPPDELSDQAEGPLVTLLTALGVQLELLEAEVDWLYDDQFIETCADWVIPYIGALVGARIVDTGDASAARQQVANTIRDRRAKGTARALAGRAQSVMAADAAEAIEYAQYVARAYNPNFPDTIGTATASINAQDGRTMSRPSAIRQHLVELRDMREGGRFAPANVGARVWTTRSYEHRHVLPALVDAATGRFRFDPVDQDVALWTPGGERDADRARLLPDQIPGPIPLTTAVDEPGIFYPGDISISIGGNPRPLSKICFCDLSDAPGGGWNVRGKPEADAADQIRIDPRLGRLVLPGNGVGIAPDSIRVRYHRGDALAIGGLFRTEKMADDEARLEDILGERDRRRERLVDFTAPRTIPLNVPPADVAAKFKTALDELAQSPALRLDFGGTYAAPATTTLPAGKDFELRGGDEVWPTIVLPGSWTIKGGAGSILTLRGVRIAGGDLVIKADGLQQLTLIDCTLVPGSARLLIEEPLCKLVAVRSILGAVRTAPAAEIDLLDCVVDSGAADVPSIAALDDTAGGILWTERSTIIGDVRLLAIDEVSNSILAERPTRAAAGPSVTVQRLQSGCVRYSAVPRGSLVPRRYRCFPSEAETRSATPAFAGMDYGDAAYATLVAANPDQLLIGAEAGREMGAGNRTSVHRGRRLLDADLIDWVPFGMAAATELVSE